MKKTQLATAIVLATTAFSAYSAKYSVTPLPVTDLTDNSFAQSIDNSGAMLTTVRNEFNPPIDIDRLDEMNFFDDNDNLQDADAAQQGNFTTADYNFIVSYLYSEEQEGLRRQQRLAQFRSYKTDTVNANLVPGFDEIDERYNDYTRSVYTLARDSLNNDFVVGSTEGVYETLKYENDDEQQATYISTFLPDQAFVQVSGETVRLPPVEELLGGLADAYAVNANFQVAGFSSAGYNDSIQDAIDICVEQETVVPDEVCINRVRRAGGTGGFTANTHRRATVWQLDASGQTISTTAYPLIFEPEEGTLATYSSIARDINAQGVAVGQSHTGDTVDYTLPSSNPRRQRFLEYVATTFADGESTEILSRENNLQSTAYAVNDNGWVVGTVLRAPNDIARELAFVYNLETMEERYIEGLFSSSETIPNAINNNNIVVGQVDTESSNDSLRQTHAFRYNIDTEEFVDLNDLVSCDNEYELIEAVDINDNGAIIANARVVKKVRNIDGTDRLDSAGELSTAASIVAVKLSPTPNGQIETCGDEEDEGYEREGAATSPWWLLLLGGGLFFRRWK